MLFQVLRFLRNPVYIEDEDMSFGHRLGVLMSLLSWSLLVSISLGLFIGLLESSTSFDLGRHAMDRFLEQVSPWLVAVAAVILAPVLEEVLFRGPLVFFRDSRYFPLAFYVLTFLFAAYHISNFELSREVLLLSPLLITPQLSVGCFLGYIRVRLGLAWAIGLHALYNLVLLIPVLIVKQLQIPVP